MLVWNFIGKVRGEFLENKATTFESGISETFESLLTKVNTCMPGQIISFDSELQTCSVQPCLMRKYFNKDEAEQLPIIEDVPVLFPGSENFWLTFDVKADSYCWLMFCQRSMDVWEHAGGIVNPASRRLKALNK